MIMLKNILERNINLIIFLFKTYIYLLTDAIFIEIIRGFNESKA